MSANKLFLEESIVKAAGVPVDMNAAAFAGERINLKHGCKVAIVCHMGDSVGAAVNFTLKQHDAATAGTTKDLSVANVYFTKAGAATSFTKVEPTVAAAAYNLAADFAAQEGIVVFEVLESDLDINNGFNHVSIIADDSGAAKLLSVLYVIDEAYVKPAYDLSV